MNEIYLVGRHQLLRSDRGAFQENDQVHLSPIVTNTKFMALFEE